MTTNFWDITIGGLIVAFFVATVSIGRQYVRSQAEKDKDQAVTNAGFLKALQHMAAQMEIAIALINERDLNQKEVCVIHNRETAEIRRGFKADISKIYAKIDNNERRILILEERIK